MSDQTDYDSSQRLISKDISEKVKATLAEQLGTEPDNIEDEDSFIDNLNMTPSEIYDFIQSLNEKGVDISGIDLKEIETVGDILEILSSEEYL